MSCHAGSVNRKKFNGLPKIGSATPPVACGAYQKSANVGRCAIRAKPVTPANTMEMPSEMTRKAGWTDQADRLAREDERAKIRQVGLMSPPYSSKCAVEEQKRNHCKDHKTCNLQPQSFLVDASKTRRLEPERSTQYDNAIRPTRKNPESKSDKKEEPASHLSH